MTTSPLDCIPESTQKVPRSSNSRSKRSDTARPLSSEFFDRPTCVVARELLGKMIVRRHEGRIVRAMVTEAEAYDGPDDRACHASRGKTARNAVMFGDAGRFYVYLIYGMYWMLNVVTGPVGYPAAVLLRGVRVELPGRVLDLDGPGKLTRHLDIDKRFYGLAADQGSGLWFEDGPAKPRPEQIVAGQRVGVNYAGPWAEKLFNFRLSK